MAITTVFVIYSVVGELQHRIKDESPENAMQIQVNDEVEILLLDILHALPLPLNFTYWAATMDSSDRKCHYIKLRSPTSIVPVYSDGSIRLKLEKSSFIPYIPVKQALVYTDWSRRCLYNHQMYQDASLQATTIRAENHGVERNRFSSKTTRLCNVNKTESIISSPQKSEPIQNFADFNNQTINASS